MTTWHCRACGAGVLGVEDQLGAGVEQTVSGPLTVLRARAVAPGLTAARTGSREWWHCCRAIAARRTDGSVGVYLDDVTDGDALPDRVRWPPPAAATHAQLFMTGRDALILGGSRLDPRCRVVAAQLEASAQTGLLDGLDVMWIDADLRPELTAVHGRSRLFLRLRMEGAWSNVAHALVFDGFVLDPSRGDLAERLTDALGQAGDARVSGARVHAAVAAQRERARRGRFLRAA
jgi:hypothetical protein